MSQSCTQHYLSNTKQTTKRFIPGLRDGSTDTRRDRLARVADKVGHREDLRWLGSVVLKVPVVRELEREARVVRRLDDDDVGHEVGTEQQRERLDDVRPLRLVARQREHGELLLGPEHDELGTEHDARLLGLVVVELHGRIVRRAVGDDACAIASAVLELLVLGGEQVLDDLGQLLLPELLVGQQHVALAGDARHGARLDVT
jgi:hypothetical protein